MKKSLNRPRLSQPWMKYLTRACHVRSIRTVIIHSSNTCFVLARCLPLAPAIRQEANRSRNMSVSDGGDVGYKNKSVLHKYASCNMVPRQTHCQFRARQSSSSGAPKHCINLIQHWPTSTTDYGITDLNFCTSPFIILAFF